MTRKRQLKNGCNDVYVKGQTPTKRTKALRTPPLDVYSTYILTKELLGISDKSFNGGILVQKNMRKSVGTFYLFIYRYLLSIGFHNEIFWLIHIFRSKIIKYSMFCSCTQTYGVWLKVCYVLLQSFWNKTDVPNYWLIMYVFIVVCGETTDFLWVSTSAVYLLLIHLFFVGQFTLQYRPKALEPFWKTFVLICYTYLLKDLQFFIGLRYFPNKCAFVLK